MKNIFSLLIFCVYFQPFYSQDKKVFNKIDSLNTTKEVQEFLDNDQNKINYYLKVEDKIDYDRYCALIADSLKIEQNWEKQTSTIMV
jgi:hypothetical protein